MTRLTQFLLAIENEQSCEAVYVTKKILDEIRGNLSVSQLCKIFELSCERQEKTPGRVFFLFRHKPTPQILESEDQEL